MKDHVIIFFHFAGGNRYSLKPFEKLLNTNSFYIELPGRGRRIVEDLISDINKAVQDIYNQIEPLIEAYPSYSFFGHSMGSLISYLTIHYLLENNKKLPSHLFVSGKEGPAFDKERKQRYKLSSEEFWQEVNDLNGTSKEILDNEELVALFEPILRADFQIIEDYVHQPKPILNIPIIGFHGTDNDVTTEEIEAWQEETNNHFERHQYPGGHFFILEQLEEISKIINNQIG